MMQTPLLKSAAICLNIRPFSKTSQMVTWFSAEHGLLATPIKGAQRPKSGFVGKFDLAYTCEIVFYAHTQNGTHHIRECTPLHLREPLRSDWRRAVAAAYLCDLTLRLTHPGLPNAPLFAHLEEVLEALVGAQKAELPLLLLWYESTLLADLGVSPDFACCPVCETTERHLFSLEEGHFLCPHRPTRLPKPLTLTLHNEVPALFERFVRCPLAETLRLARASTRTDDLGRPEPFPGIFGLRRFLGIFLNQTLDLLPGPRRTALDLLI